MEKIIILATKDGKQHQFPVEIKHLSLDALFAQNSANLEAQGYHVDSYIKTGTPDRHRRGISRSWLPHS